MLLYSTYKLSKFYSPLCVLCAGVNKLISKKSECIGRAPRFENAPCFLTLLSQVSPLPVLISVHKQVCKYQGMHMLVIPCTSRSACFCLVITQQHSCVSSSVNGNKFLLKSCFFLKKKQIPKDACSFRGKFFVLYSCLCGWEADGKLGHPLR